jgi:hypothetical protein
MKGPMNAKNDSKGPKKEKNEKKWPYKGKNGGNRPSKIFLLCKYQKSA